MDKVKTNAIRIIEKHKIPYTIHHYESDGFTDGVNIAKKLGINPCEAFKTLVTRGKTGNFYVFVVPVMEELDLKKAAKASKEKNIEMIAVSEINKITGYIRGGCSPVGMKKAYKTFIDSSCLLNNIIYVSAGRIGDMVSLSPSDLLKITGGSTFDITRKEIENEL